MTQHLTHPRSHTSRLTSLAMTAGLLLTAGACGDDSESDSTAPATTDRADTSIASDTPSLAIDPGDGGDYRPDLDPTQVVERIDNPYLPLVPGSRWVYEGASEGEVERIEVEVLDEHHTVMGIEAVVVRDTVTIGGELVEDTYDWYIQDTAGNVWYLGEDTEEYEDGEVVSTAGSWAAGVDGALPGIVMPAEPTVGDAYRQEFLAGEAEDMAEVIRVGDTRQVAAGTYTDVIVTADWTPLDPEVVEEKSYAPEVGFVHEIKTAGGDGEVELISFTPGG